MPKINVSKKELDLLIGKKIELDKLNDLMTNYLKAEIDSSKENELTVKFEDTNRPDLWSAEGIARNLKNLLGITSGLHVYKTENAGYVVNVDDKKLEDKRPFIACAVIKNIKLTDELIKSFMQMQDKLDTNYGRKRKKTSIGFYDLDKLSFPIIYTTVASDHAKFVPLGFDKEMNMKEIINTHPKGIEYGHLVKSFKEYPVLIDSNSKILSFPPIINSNDLGNINEETKNLLIEVTGTDHSAVMNTLGIITIALADHEAKIYSVDINYKKKKERTPDLKPIEFSFKPSGIRKVLGLNLNNKEIQKILEKMGYDVLNINKESDKATVEAPFYRKDIMHDVDIIEDIAIGYGYNEIEPVSPRIATEGSLDKLTTKTDLIRDIMIGIGHQEILSFMLTNKNTMFEKMNQKAKDVAELANPISTNWDILRNSLLPITINFLAINKTVEFPQRIFEVGDVVSLDDKEENKVKQKRNLCAAISHSKATFTEIKSVLDKLLSDLGLIASIKPIDNPSFIEGRCGEILIYKKPIGIIGEIHPQVLINFGLENPVSIFEINIEEL